VTRAPSALAGIGLVILATAGFATLDTTTKFVSASVPLLMALWFRYFFQAVATTAVILPLRGMKALRTAHPKFQCLRGLLLLMSSLFAFLSLKYMPVAEFTAIGAIVPLIITLLAATALGEKVSALRWALVIGGFVGTLTIIRPGGEDFSWALLLPLGMVATNTGFQVLTSKLARTEDPITMHLYTGWVGTLLVSAALPFVWISLPSWSLWGWLVLMAFPADPGLYAGACRHAHALPLRPDCFCDAGRLDRFFACAGSLVARRHVADRHLRRRRGLAHCA
jgi:drug/metabolite transporter (DMT)-like permease